MWRRSPRGSAAADTSAPVAARSTGLSAAMVRILAELKSGLQSSNAIQKRSQYVDPANLDTNPRFNSPAQIRPVNRPALAIESCGSRTRPRHGLAPAGRLLRFPVLLRPRILWLASARMSHATRKSRAKCWLVTIGLRPRSAASRGWRNRPLLLAGDAGVQRLRSERLGCAPSFGGRRHSDGGRDLSFPAAISSRHSNWMER